MVEFNRRNFLRLTGAVLAGAAVGEASSRAAAQISSRIDPASNDDILIRDTVLVPVAEELVFRGLPSAAVSALEYRPDKSADFLIGTARGWGMTRREVLTGAFASLAYGEYHVLTFGGLEARRVPASQVTRGMLYWYLQRKLGIVSNTVAHGWYNFKAPRK